MNKNKRKAVVKERKRPATIVVGKAMQRHSDGFEEELCHVRRGIEAEEARNQWKVSSNGNRTSFTF